MPSGPKDTCTDIMHELYFGSSHTHCTVPVQCSCDCELWIDLRYACVIKHCHRDCLYTIVVGVNLYC